MLIYYYYYLITCRRPTTCPCQMPLSLVSVASSAASRAPVSLFMVSTYVALGLPRPLRPWLGSHSTRGCALSFGWRMQWPASCSLLAALLCCWHEGGLHIGPRWECGWASECWGPLRSILVYVPSSECSMASVSAQASHPYKRMDSTVPLKKRTFSSLLRLDLWEPARLRIFVRLCLSLFARPMITDIWSHRPILVLCRLKCVAANVKVRISVFQKIMS